MMTFKKLYVSFGIYSLTTDYELAKGINVVYERKKNTTKIANNRKLIK